MRDNSSLKLAQAIFLAGWGKWLRLARHPVFATLANFLGVIAGVLGSLYTQNILAAFPFAWHDLQHWEWTAAGFWICLFVFAFTFLSREWAIHELRQESEERLAQSQQRLLDTMVTMPPRGFVLELANYYEQCHKAVSALRNAPTLPRDKIEQVIRFVLWSIASLARKYDAELDATYGANVMLYFGNVSSWSQYTGEDPNKLDMRFVEPEAAKERLPVLVLQKSLSAYTRDGNAGEPDASLQQLGNLALPILDQNHGRSADGKRWRVLAGAPLTFVCQEPNAYPDSRRIADWCRESGDFSSSICQEVDHYFNAEPAATSFRSFASLPITCAVNRKRIGVLNLHSNKVQLLYKSETPSQFYPVLVPFQILLSDLLKDLLKISG